MSNSSRFFLLWLLKRSNRCKKKRDAFKWISQLDATFRQVKRYGWSVKNINGCWLSGKNCITKKNFEKGKDFALCVGIIYLFFLYTNIQHTKALSNKFQVFSINGNEPIFISGWCIARISNIKNMIRIISVVYLNNPYKCKSNENGAHKIRISEVM